MKELPNNFKLIFSCLAGSHMYGTNTPESDIDTRGVFIPSKEYFLGSSKRIEQVEIEGQDTTYFEIRKFLFLASQCNPNIVELLFVPKDRSIIWTDEWQEIVSNREYFLSTKARHTFSGYAYSQLNRIRNHRAWLLNPPIKKPEREDFGLPPTRSLLTEDEIGAFNYILVNALEEIQMHHPLQEQLKEMKETLDFYALVQNMKSYKPEAIQQVVEVSDSFMQALTKEKAYKQALNHWNSYQNWKKNRNPKRAVLEEHFFYDVKHAAHLYRLLTEGKELLTKGYITLPRPDSELLLEIKNGKWSYDELMKEIDKFDIEFDELYKTSPLPKQPDLEKIDELCMKIISKYIQHK